MSTARPKSNLDLSLPSTACNFTAIFNFGDSNSDTGGKSAAFSRFVIPADQSTLPRGAPLSRQELPEILQSLSAKPQEDEYMFVSQSHLASNHQPMEVCLQQPTVVLVFVIQKSW